MNTIQGSKKKVVFIGSASRSGSTILDMMLGNGEGCFSLGEVNAHFRPYRKHHLNSLCSCGDAFCSIRRSFRKIKEKDVYDHVFDNLETNTIIDSSKELNWIVDQYGRLSKRNDIQKYAILIYKEPVSLAHSYYKRGESLMKFRSKYRYYKEFAQTGIPFITVKYSNLVNDPKGIIARLCEIIGIEFFDGKEEYWNKDMHHFFGSNSVIQTYESNEPKIRATEEFRKDFVSLIPKIEEEINTNRQLQNILGMLKKNRATEKVSANTSFKRVRKPIWYYKRKLKSIYRRIFLEEYHERVIST